MTITRQSAKDKGKAFQKWTSEKIAEIVGLECGKDCPVEPRPGCLSGVDVMLDQQARKLFPFSVECKFQENWYLPEWIAQAKKNVMKGTNWILFIKKSWKDPVVVLDASVFLEMQKELIMLRGFKEFVQSRKENDD